MMTSVPLGHRCILNQKDCVVKSTFCQYNLLESLRVKDI